MFKHCDPVGLILEPKYKIRTWPGYEDEKPIRIHFDDSLEWACKNGTYEEIQAAFDGKLSDDDKIAIVLRCDHQLTKKCKINLKKVLPMIYPHHCFRHKLLNMVETYIHHEGFRLGNFVRAIIREGYIVEIRRLANLGIRITGKHLELFEGDFTSLLFFAFDRKIVAECKTEEKFKPLSLYPRYKEEILTEQKKVILTTELLPELQSLIASYL